MDRPISVCWGNYLHGNNALTGASMDKHIYDKTDKGREEIATRKYHLAAKLRSLLVMIDGHRSLEALMKQFSPLGLSAEHVAELLRDEYIVLVDAGVPEAAPEVAAAHRPSLSAKARMDARRQAAIARGTHHEDDLYGGPTTIAQAEAETSAAPTAQGGMTDAERHMAVQDFYTQTIKSTLGLRGMMLQLKVEKCSNLEDFRALRDTYVEAVLKAKGREMALSLSTRLDQLLGINGERAA